MWCDLVFFQVYNTVLYLVPSHRTPHNLQCTRYLPTMLGYLCIQTASGFDPQLAPDCNGMHPSDQTGHLTRTYLIMFTLVTLQIILNGATRLALLCQLAY